MLLPLPMFLPEFPISPLHILQPFLLELRPGQILGLQINNILPIVRIRVEWVLLVFDDAWHACVDVIELFAVNAQDGGPQAAHLAEHLQDVLGRWAVLFVVVLPEVLQPLAADFYDVPLAVVSLFLLLTD